MHYTVFRLLPALYSNQRREWREVTEGSEEERELLQEDNREQRGEADTERERVMRVEVFFVYVCACV